MPSTRMSPDDAVGPPARPPATGHPGIRRRRAGLLVVVAFALGALAGWLAVGAFGEAPGAGAPPGSTAAAARSSPPAEPLAEGTGARLTDACLQALSAAEDTVLVLEEIGGALAALDARRLDRVIHDLRPLRDRLRAGTAACDVEVPRPAPAGGTELPAAPSTGP